MNLPTAQNERAQRIVDLQDERSALALRISDLGDEIRLLRKSRLRGGVIMVGATVLTVVAALTLTKPAAFAILAGGWSLLVLGLGGVYREVGRLLRERRATLESLVSR